jgi:hypothetical protein
MDALLYTQTESCGLAMRELELFKDNSGGVCYLEVVSKPFSVATDFFFDTHSLKDFVKNLEEIEINFVGEAKLGLEYEEPYILFRGDRLGHVKVSGLLIDTRENMQKLEFSFQTDQTSLRPFIANLREICNSYV